MDNNFVSLFELQFFYSSKTSFSFTSRCVCCGGSGLDFCSRCYGSGGSRSIFGFRPPGEWNIFIFSSDEVISSSTVVRKFDRVFVAHLFSSANGFFQRLSVIDFATEISRALWCYIGHICKRSKKIGWEFRVPILTLGNVDGYPQFNLRNDFAWL